jgi:adenosylcobinamide-phosphate guanylyltransferase
VDRTLAACGHGPADADGSREGGGGDGSGDDGSADGDAVVGSTPSVAVSVPAALKRRLGASCERTSLAGDGDGDEGGGGSRELAPTGLNVAGTGPDRTLVSWDARLAVNVNRPADRELAEVLS